ncbi:MAG: NUDIX hydrolase [Ignavibacteria bacterium]|nr:NUDIX hydrolase [Ignavibacteria bacterium]
MNFTITKSEIIFRGKVFDLQVDEIEYNSGNKGVRETAIHHGGAVIVALTNEYKIVFVNQFRYPHQKYLLELPAGKLNEREDPQTCAVRELEEETGYRAKKISKLGAIATTPGFCTEILHIYLAEELTPGEHNREEGESGMEIHEFTLNEIDDKIKNGEIYDAKTISGIMLAKYRLTNDRSQTD